jgi:uncharacterized protein YpbB
MNEQQLQEFADDFKKELNEMLRSIESKCDYIIGYIDCMNDMMNKKQ